MSTHIRLSADPDLAPPDPEDAIDLPADLSGAGIEADNRGGAVAGVDAETGLLLLLLLLPAVAAAAVVAKQDDKWGEVPCAFVELRPGENPTEEDIINFCRENMAGFKRPKKIVFGDLPKTATGKIQKFVLREKAKTL